MNVKHVKAQKAFKFSELSPGECLYRKDSSSVLMKLNNVQPNVICDVKVNEVSKDNKEDV